MKHKYLCLIFATISLNCTLLTNASFAQTSVVEKDENSVSLETANTLTNEDVAKDEVNSQEIVQAEVKEPVKQNQPSVRVRIPIQSRVFMAPIMQQ